MRKHRTLWRDKDFMRLWAGQTISRFGSTITGFALQLTALLLLGATPFEMGLLAAVASIPSLFGGLFIGSLADRVQRRPLMISADIFRTIALALVPLLALSGHLQLIHLLLVSAVVGGATLVFEVCHQSYVPAMVGDDLVEANGKLAMSDSLAEIAGTSLAGLLVGALGAPFAILVDCSTYLASAFFLRSISRSEVPVTRLNDDSGNALSGLGLLVRHPVLRALAAHQACSSLFGNFFAALYALYCVRTLGMSPTLVGISIAVGGVGSWLGSVTSARVIARWGLGPTICGCIVVTALTAPLIPAAGGPVLQAFGFIALAQLVGDAGGSIFGVAALSLRQLVTPSHLLGRVNAGMYLLETGVGPLGAALGGVLGGAIGTRETVLVAVLGLTLSKLWIVLSPIRNVVAIPASAD